MLEILIPGWKSLRHSRLGLVWITCGWARAAIIGKCVCACACVSVCVCVCVCVVESWNAQLEELKSLLGHPFELPRSPLTCLSLFSCLFLELVYKLNGPQSHRVGLLILKQDLCCRAHCFVLLSAQPPGKPCVRFE